MKIGILTGGGDVPGLNACIKAATLRATEEGHQVAGIRRGWAGLLGCDPDDPASVAANIVDLDASAVRTIDRSGGEILHTSRTNPARVQPPRSPSSCARWTTRAGGSHAARLEGARRAWALTR